MNNKKLHEKEMFNMMDELTDYIDEKYLDVFDKEDINEEEMLDDIQLENIKKNVIEKLNVKEDKKEETKYINKRKKSRRRMKFSKIAAAILIIFGLLFVAYPNEVIAVLKKPLNYIPGINTVMDSEESSERYVLEKPISINQDGMKIELMSVIVQNDDNYIFVNARGNDEKIFSEENGYKSINMLVKFRNGQVYNLKSGSMFSGGNDWNASYNNWSDVNEKNIKSRFLYKEGDTIEVIIGTEDKVNIPVTLIKAPSFEDYSEIGPTTEVNDISVTAIPSFDDNDLTINLASPKIQGQMIDQYALSPDFSFNQDRFKYKGILNERIALYDDYGNLVKGKGVGSYTPPLSEFHFDITESVSNKFKLVIPYIKMKYNIDKKFRIKLPEVGESLEYEDYILDFNDYKLKINKIERINTIPGESVKIYFDTGYDEYLDESMYSIMLAPGIKAFDEPIYQSWSGNFGEDDDENMVGALKVVDISLNKEGLKKFDLYIDSIITIKRGPWKFEIER
ncbi:hypothetical protein SH2C18_46440 [Clostridium sediminicola]|uniref:hypothetical protein n=1 Tax=Clostridium sediminicola TaxID=3114879 RepID=UPI0031F23E73